MQCSICDINFGVLPFTDDPREGGSGWVNVSWIEDKDSHKWATGHLVFCPVALGDGLLGQRGKEERRDQNIEVVECAARASSCIHPYCVDVWELFGSMTMWDRVTCTLRSRGIKFLSLKYLVEIEVQEYVRGYACHCQSYRLIHCDNELLELVSSGQNALIVHWRCAISASCVFGKVVPLLGGGHQHLDAGVLAGVAMTWNVYEALFCSTR